jgi:hypothetical protein
VGLGGIVCLANCVDNLSVFVNKGFIMHGTLTIYLYTSGNMGLLRPKKMKLHTLRNISQSDAAAEVKNWRLLNPELDKAQTSCVFQPDAKFL